VSIEDLKADLASNMTACRALIARGVLLTPVDLAKHQLDQWAFLENVVTDFEELDGTVSDLYHNAEDILQPETAAVFAAVAAGGLGLVGELEKRLTPADGKIRAAIAEFKKLAIEATDILREITIPDDDDDEEDEEEDEEDDDATNDNTAAEAE
jgi:hypothetical protein